MPGMNNRLPRQMQGSPWRTMADNALAPLFACGKQPTRKELIEAYPFYERRYWPYKIWLQQVAWWKKGCPPDKRRKDARTPALPGQEAML